jgi:hypothetical protein
MNGMGTIRAAGAAAQENGGSREANESSSGAAEQGNGGGREANESSNRAAAQGNGGGREANSAQRVPGQCEASGKVVMRTVAHQGAPWREPFAERPPPFPCAKAVLIRWEAALSTAGPFVDRAV